jgi:thiamine-phosphate pyrophosphorylase
MARERVGAGMGFHPFPSDWKRAKGQRMTDFTDEELALDPHFADQFEKDFADRLAQAFDGGQVAAFQLRLKGVDDDTIARLAEPLQRLCAQREVAFIINDSVALAQRLGADGVHLGQGDGDAREARKILGPKVQIGVTCHDSRHLAMEAGEAGADYVAFGAFYPTTTKEVLHRAEPSILGWWTTLFELPCVAIGGITADNAAPLVAAGADFLAVSSAVWAHPDGPEAGVRAFAKVLGTG